MPVLRIFFLSAILLISALPHSATAFSLKYQLTPHSYQDIFYYYEEPAGQGDSLFGHFDPFAQVEGFMILDFSNFDRASFPDGYFLPDVTQYAFTNGLRTFDHLNSEMNFDFSTKFGPNFEMERFGVHLREDRPVGDVSTLYLSNSFLEGEFSYLYLPAEPGACDHGDFGLCTEYSRGISRNAVTWTVSSVPTPGAIGTLSSGLMLMGGLAAWRNRSRTRQG